MVDYIIRAALTEETNDGWVWICGRSTKHLDSRTVVWIKRPGYCHALYAEVRKIDDNFRVKYNNAPRIKLEPEREILVMGESYRRALAIPCTTAKDNQTHTVSLIVKKARIKVWRSLRAACHHPDPVVRLGTRLGILSVWLGLLGVWLGLLGVCTMSSVALKVGSGSLGILGIIGVSAACGPPRPRLS
jgi:hypothetical protein